MLRLEAVVNAPLLAAGFFTRIYNGIQHADGEVELQARSGASYRVNDNDPPGHTIGSGRLVLLPVTNGTATYTLPMSSKVTGHVQGRGVYNLQRFTHLRIKIDTRSVQTNSGSFFDSAGKNWRKEGNDQRLVNLRMSDGAQVVDAVADYDAGPGWWRGGATFTAK